MSTSSHSSVLVTTLGLFILDNFEWRSAAAAPLDDSSQSTTRSTLTGPTTILRRSDLVIGGGGTYTIIGSRIWLSAQQCAMIVDRGCDWLELNRQRKVESELKRFGQEMWYWRDLKQGEETCKALNLYTGEHRDFKYLTPRTRLEPQDLPSPLLNSTRSLHFICSPERAIVILDQIVSLPAATSAPMGERLGPMTFYEPIPSSCLPENLETLQDKVLNRIDVFSPNHEEASAFHGFTTEQVVQRGKDGIEKLAEEYVRRMLLESRRERDEVEVNAPRREKRRKIVVIRSGAWGAYYLSRWTATTAQDESGEVEEKGWIDAYHRYVDKSEMGQIENKVKDVTGAGNSFIGGLMAGLTTGKGLKESVMMASISASLTIEQFGLPRLDPPSTSLTGKQTWNDGVDPWVRLEEMKKREIN